MSAIFNLIKKYFKKDIDLLVRMQVRAQQQKARETESKRHTHAAVISLQQYIGKAVMYFPNEISNPVIGIGKEIVYITKANQPCLVVKDYISNQDMSFFGSPIFYHPMTLRSIMELDDHSRIAILHRLNPDHIMNKEPLEDILTYTQALERLQVNGFFDKIKKENET